jgi:uncharacterized membrane protein HdeD (DUF308 family)
MMAEVPRTGRAGWDIALGIVLMLAGFFVLGNVVATTLSVLLGRTGLTLQPAPP